VASQQAEFEKSIAVLPLANMSPDEENAFFADGVHEDVLTNLSKIQELHVIGRTSTLQYRDTVKTLQQIGGELNVRYLLEGSVRRARNRVLVTVQLIDAQNEGHLWAENYSRELTDIFAIQADIAKAIAGQLHAVISPEEIEKIEYRPTENPEAYDAYVQARQLRVTRGPGAGPQRVRLLETAVELDPEFGEAWYLLALETLALRVGRGRGTSAFASEEEKMNRAHEALREAERLMPNSPEVLYAQAEFLQTEENDPQAAIERLLDVLAIDPDFRDANYKLSGMYEWEGRYLESQRYAVATLRNDPIQAQTFRRLAILNMRMHNWDKASYYLKQRANAFSLAFNGSGGREYTISKDTLAADYLTGVSPEALLQRVDSAQNLENKWMWYWACGDAAGVIQNMAPDEMDQWETALYIRLCHASWAKGLAHKIIGEEETARTILIEFRDFLFELQTTPGFQSSFNRRFGLVHAVLGEEDTALEIFDQLMSSVGENPQDTATRMDIEKDRALALAWLGRLDEAVVELDRLIKEPIDLNVHLMRHCLDFWPLRDHPGFQAILDDPANNQPLPPEKL
jgi:TolB-like protein